MYLVDDEDTEPPVPAGLGDLSAPLQAIADFLMIDQDLIAVAAETSPGIMAEEDGGLTEWIASGPAIPSRTVAELLKAAEDHRAAREMAAELHRREEEAREAAAKAAAYAKRLDDLAPRIEGACSAG